MILTLRDDIVNILKYIISVFFNYRFDMVKRFGIYFFTQYTMNLFLWH